MAKVTGTPKKAQPKPRKPALVKMVRDGAKADVHPNEVENYKQGGWVVNGADD